MTMATRIQRNGNGLSKGMTSTNQKNGWKQKSILIKEETGIKDEDTTVTKNITKGKIAIKINKYFNEIMIEQRKNK